MCYADFKLPNRRSWAVVVAQLVERSFPTPEIRSSNPVISKFYLLLTTFKNVLKIRK